VDKAK
jgi:hypothetical protein